MAVQTTPHTMTDQDTNSAATDLEPNMAPEDTLRADPSLFENSDGAQTGGTRAFNANAGRDNQPKSLDEGTANTPSGHSVLPQGEGHGITNAPATDESGQQEKVLGK